MSIFKKSSLYDDARAEVERLVALEREQMRQRKDLDSQRAEQERQAQEIEKHEAWLRKHDEEIAKLQYRISEAERVLDHYKPLLERKQEEAKELDLKIWWYEKQGLPCAGMKQTLDRKNEEVFKLEGKVRKAQFDKEQAEKKMEVA